MSKFKWLSIIGCVGVYLSLIQISLAQPVRITIYMQDRFSQPDSVTIGFDPAATNNFDPGLDESKPAIDSCPLCSIPQDIRSVSVDSGIGRDTCQDGLAINIHHEARGNQADRWKIQFHANGAEDGGRLTFRWAANLAATGGGKWLLQDASGYHLFPDIDMTTRTSFLHPIRSTDPYAFYISTSDGFKYRTMKSAEFALADPRGKSIKRKPVRVEFGLTVYSDSDNVDGLHMEFVEPIDTTWPFTTIPPSTITRAETKGHKWDFSFAAPINAGDSVQIYGYGKGGKVQKIPKYWWWRTGVENGPKRKTVSFTLNQPRLPLPNLDNLGEELYAQGAFPPDVGLTVGLPSSVKRVIHKKWKDVLATLIKKDFLHNLAPRCLDIFDNTGHQILAVQKTLPPTKHNNTLLAEAIAFKLNLACSSPVFAKTPVGLADVIFESSNSRYSRYNGLPLHSLADILDTALSCAPSAFVGSDPDSLQILYEIVYSIDSAFSGPIDTLSFGVPQAGKPAGGTVLDGVTSIGEVPFLYRPSVVNTPFVMPSYQELADVPSKFELMQNYPNPFNPVTTLSFVIGQPSMVTLKVYNVLGQEVATLLNHELLDAGEQEVNFDATNLASGVYLYRIVAQTVAGDDAPSAGNQFVSVRKMILMK